MKPSHRACATALATTRTVGAEGGACDAATERVLDRRKTPGQGGPMVTIALDLVPLTLIAAALAYSGLVVLAMRPRRR